MGMKKNRIYRVLLLAAFALAVIGILVANKKNYAAVLEEYQGEETYIDRNVFRGTKEELQKLMVSCGEEKDIDMSDRNRYDLIWSVRVPNGRQTARFRIQDI